MKTSVVAVKSKSHTLDRLQAVTHYPSSRQAQDLLLIRLPDSARAAALEDLREGWLDTELRLLR
jgi:hypothetical protein